MTGSERTFQPEPKDVLAALDDGIAVMTEAIAEAPAQKAFYEIPLPKRHKYMVIVQIDTERDYADCAVPQCKSLEAEYWDTQFDEVYQCDCCAQWFCIDHIDKNSLCKACAALPIGLRGKVIDFREELNHAI
jgi:hypothetical protein